MIRLSFRRIIWCSPLAGLVLLTGCTREWKSQPVSMWNESRYKPLEASPAFNGSSSQPLVPGTVARGQLRLNDALYTGRTGGTNSALVTTIPIAINERVLARGQERYNVFCAPCHARDGRGQGMIVRRGFPAPPDYRIARLRNAPIGHFYDVITNGYGVMYSYASRVQPHDRWAIAAYIRVLQNTQKEIPPDVRKIEGLGNEEFTPELNQSKRSGTTSDTVRDHSAPTKDSVRNPPTPDH